MVACTHVFAWMYTSRYLAVSGVSMVYKDSETLVGVYQTTILYFLLVGLYTVLNSGFLYKKFELDPSTHTSLESSRKGGSNGLIIIFGVKTPIIAPAGRLTVVKFYFSMG